MSIENVLSVCESSSLISLEVGFHNANKKVLRVMEFIIHCAHIVRIVFSSKGNYIKVILKLNTGLAVSALELNVFAFKN